MACDMKNVARGFDLERFFQPPPEDFICSICNGVLNSPKQTFCGHVFCTQCITTWLSPPNSHTTCPVCSDELNSQQLINPAFMVINMLKSLKLRCVYGPKGCTDQTITMDSLKRHEDECDYGPGICPHEGCPNNTDPAELKRLDISSHVRHCEWREIDCPHACGARVLAKDVHDHTESTCTSKIVTCLLGCGQTMRRADLKHHEDKACTKALTKCETDGCEFRTQRGAHEEWEKHASESRIVHPFLQNFKKQEQAISQLHTSKKELEDALGQLTVTVQRQQQTIQDLQVTVIQQAKLITTLETTHKHQQGTINELQTSNTDLQDILKQLILTLKLPQSQSVFAVDRRQSVVFEEFFFTPQGQTTPQLPPPPPMNLDLNPLAPSYVADLIQSYAPAMDVPPRSVDWVVRGLTSKWSSGFKDSSPELCFSLMSNPMLRYSFKVLVLVNCSSSTNRVGVFFVPRRGANPSALKWPINNLVQIDILNVNGGANKTKVLNKGVTKEYFSQHAPPAEDIKLGPGLHVLSKEEVESTNYVLDDAIVVRISLLDKTFD
eukprot:c6596_g1_i1.p1 GENE.c6596_g1_i1~~c6596_g1_i1.p1  ORF type:complete len:550 (+),score=91.68 c6596_g1_i1:295-1944(+)